MHPAAKWNRLRNMQPWGCCEVCGINLYRWSSYFQEFLQMTETQDVCCSSHLSVSLCVWHHWVGGFIFLGCLMCDGRVCVSQWVTVTSHCCWLLCYIDVTYTRNHIKSLVRSDDHMWFLLCFLYSCVTHRLFTYKSFLCSNDFLCLGCDFFLSFRFRSSDRFLKTSTQHQSSDSVSCESTCDEPHKHFIKL